MTAATPVSRSTGASPLQPDSGSFRDRNNRVYDDGNRIVRGISTEALANWNALSKEPFFRGLLESGKIIGTRLLPADEVAGDAAWPAYLEHERIPFLSYPYEWCFDMLKDAALLHLDLIEKAIEADWTMKDATAYNIQWLGSRPVFIDVPSFEPYVPGSPWVGYRQFCMMFLYPLMLQAYKGIGFQSFLRGDLEGIEPSIASNLLSGRSRLRKGVPTHVYLHARMQSRYSGAELNEAKSLTEESDGKLSESRKFRHSKAMVLGTIQGLQRVVRSLSSGDKRTTWGNYDTDHSYGEASFETKKAFVEKAASARSRKLVWDLGSNTGTFSRICANHADYVVSVDGDTKAINRFYEAQKVQQQGNICPLIMNLANISPGQGWRGRERKAFDERGKPDLVLCLALIHHIVISANIPLAEFLGWLRSLDAEIVIEFVSVEDDMSKMLLRNRVNQYSDMTEAGFESMVSQSFDIVSSQSLKGTHRKLYHLAPR